MEGSENNVELKLNKMENLKELSLYELNNIQGGLAGAPPRFITDTAVVVGRTVSAWWKGFKNGTELF